MKKIVSVMLGALIGVGAVGLAACNTPEENNPDAVKTYQITVWSGDGTTTITKSQIDKFNTTMGTSLNVKFEATIEQVSEGKAVGNAESHPESAADLFCFTSDNYARAVKSKLVAPLAGSSVTFLKENNIESAVNAAKMGEQYYALPITADNTYLLYYNKAKVTDEQAKHLEDLITVAEAENAKISFNLASEGSWYAASFLYGTGCKSEWTVNENGEFTAYDDTFNSENGVKAFRGMQKLMGSDCFNDSSKVSAFQDAIPSIAVVSGVWDYNDAKTILGDNLGVAALPTFTVDETEYTLTPYLGYKLMGIKPQSDATKLAYLQRLAQYLSGDECQKERFTQLGWLPTNKTLASDEAVTSNDLYKVITNAKTTHQGAYPTSWWSQLEVQCTALKEAAKNGASVSDTAIKGFLSTYAAGLASFLK